MNTSNKSHERMRGCESLVLTFPIQPMKFIEPAHVISTPVSARQASKRV